MDDKLFLFLSRGLKAEEKHQNSLHETFGFRQYLGIS